MSFRSSVVSIKFSFDQVSFRSCVKFDQVSFDQVSFRLSVVRSSLVRSCVVRSSVVSIKSRSIMCRSIKCRFELKDHEKYDRGPEIHGEPRRVSLPVGEAQLAGCLRVQVGSPLEWDAGIQ